MKTSFIVPFKNEIEYAKKTIKTLHDFLSEQKIDFEIVAVDDSTDGTWEALQSLKASYPNMILAKGERPSGYGRALRKGFAVATGDILIPFNGDLSDSPSDAVAYIRLIEEGYDMVAGSRFITGGKISGSTSIKTIISRLANRFLQLLFCTNCSDITNSFKAYRREVISSVNLTASGYNIGMEIALKAIMQDYKYTTMPITWSEREYGSSKMSIMKSIVSYLLMAFRIRFSKPIEAKE